MNTWKREGESVADYVANGKYELDTLGRRLMVKDVQEEDRGWFSCTGKNSAGEQTVNVLLKVVCKFSIYEIIIIIIGTLDFERSWFHMK